MIMCHCVSLGITAKNIVIKPEPRPSRPYYDRPRDSHLHPHQRMAEITAVQEAEGSPKAPGGANLVPQVLIAPDGPGGRLRPPL